MEEIEKYEKLCAKESRILRELLLVTINTKSSPFYVIQPVIQNVMSEVDSLRLLALHGMVQGVYVLSRTIIETIINVLFIMSAEQDLEEKAIKHSIQKSYRDWSRYISLEALPLELGPVIEFDLDDFHELDKPIRDFIEGAVEEYTTNKGKEERKWTPESIDKKIEVISNNFGAVIGEGLQFSSFMIYRHASEIIHGTLFGAVYCLGLTTPGRSPRSKEEIIIYKSHLISTNLEVIGVTLFHFISCIAQSYNKPEFTKRGEKVLSEFVSSIDK